LRIGTEAAVEDVVTQDMRPEFDGHVVHGMYGTSAMVYHMEWAARRVILPYLEEDEEGIGTGVRLRHLSPAPVGATIRARAVCTAIQDNRVICDVEVWQDGRLLGAGQVEQRVVPRRLLRERWLEMWAQEGGFDWNL
jgi:predicted thioesterase